MKRIVFIFAALLAALCAGAQEFEPTTTWPYLYPEFTPGKLLTDKGVEKTGEYNVHILHSTLHFIQGDEIRELSRSEVYSVQIGKDYFIAVGGQLMKVVARNDNGYVAQSYEVDVVKLNSTGGAYGSSSSTLGTTALSSLEGIGNNRVSMNHMELKANKDNGQTLPLITKYFICTGGKVVYATRRDVGEKSDPAAFKAFLKSNKIKWNNPQSLLAVVDFLSSQQ
ncbi:MAG: hypothetical protein IJS66_01855 [Bacteroidales bacterium]|nr:hypothetical protein [Bacteroidales bacterium]